MPFFGGCLSSLEPDNYGGGAGDELATRMGAAGFAVFTVAVRKGADEVLNPPR